MKQAFHIFRKDVRFLRYEIALALMAAGAFAIVGMRSPNGPGPLAFVLPVTWWFLIARVIHAEALPGNRQYWLTRPYDWRSLLGAKMLFILTFICLPLVIADAAIVSAAGFSVLGCIPGLLWTQILLFAVFVIPTAALATLTSGLGELLAATLLIAISILAWILLGRWMQLGFYWTELEWVKTSLVMAEVAAVSLVLLVWQYAWRKTTAARSVTCVACLALLASSVLLPWTGAFALESHLSQRNVGVASLRVGLDEHRKWAGHVYSTDHEKVIAELPLEIAGIPSGMQLKPNGVTLSLHAPDGKSVAPDQPPPDSITVEGDITSLRAVMEKNLYERVKDQPLEVRGTLYFTLYGEQRTSFVPADTRPVVVEGVGRCSAGPHSFRCDSAFRPQAALVRLQIWEATARGPRTVSENFRAASYSPFPADLTVDPLYEFVSPRLTAISGARVDAWKPLAHLVQSFEIPAVRLGEFDQTTLSASRAQGSNQR